MQINASPHAGSSQTRDSSWPGCCAHFDDVPYGVTEARCASRSRGLKDEWNTSKHAGVSQKNISVQIPHWSCAGTPQFSQLGICGAVGCVSDTMLCVSKRWEGAGVSGRGWWHGMETE